MTSSTDRRYKTPSLLREIGDEYDVTSDHDSEEALTEGGNVLPDLQLPSEQAVPDVMDTVSFQRKPRGNIYTGEVQEVKTFTDKKEVQLRIKFQKGGKTIEQWIGSSMILSEDYVKKSTKRFGKRSSFFSHVRNGENEE